MTLARAFGGFVVGGAFDIAGYLYDPIGLLGRGRKEHLVDILAVERNHGDRAALLLLQQQRFFQRMVVEFVDLEFEPFPVQFFAGSGNLEFLDQIGHLLDGYDDIHSVQILISKFKSSVIE